jgi:uncharacterized protein (TIGR02145 family)
MAVWAPVNCGYHKDDYKYGKLYQWGRKYGQGYSGSIYDINGKNVGEVSDASVPTIEEGGVSIITGQHKSKANVFFTSTSEYNYNWLYPQDSQLWNSGSEYNPIKTEYDPCPDGWRVPTYAELNELSYNYSSWTIDENDQPGRWFSGPKSYSSDVPQVFFPAAGYRYCGDGDALRRGYYGNYWSSRPGSTYEELYFEDGTVSMYKSHSMRAYGQSVRCVME